jgi:dCMP deaminase
VEEKKQSRIGQHAHDAAKNGINESSAKSSTVTSCTRGAEFAEWNLNMLNMPASVKSEVARLFGEERTDPRPSKDERFMRDALNAARMATCPRASVGAVFVRDGHGLVSGYNGAPVDQPHCTDVGCFMEAGHCKRSAHAEQNAITWAARLGVSLERSVCYVTHFPCTTCANMLINLGVVRIVYLNEYTPADGGDFLRLAGVPVERIEF